MHLSVARCFVFLLLATTTAALIVYVFGYMPFWPVEYQHWLAIPYNDGLTSGLVSSGFILTTSVLVFLFNPRWLPIAVAALLAAIWLWMEVRPMGDSGHWLAHAASKDLWLSEFLANYFFHLTYQLGIEFQYVAPVFGALLVLSWFSLKPVLFEPADDGVWWLVLTFSLTSSVVMALYTRNFIENTLLSVPVLLFHLRYALHYVRTGQHLSRRYAAVLLALAILIHGQNMFMLPAFLLLVLIYPAALPTRIAIKVAFHTGLLIMGCIVTVILLFQLAGFNAVSGNIQGGGDGTRFIPILQSQASHFVRFLMFSPAHFVELSNIMLHVAPLLLWIPFLLLKTRYTGATSWLKPLMNDSILASLAIYACAYLGFIFLWNFDLGYPTDLDLMVSLGVTLNIAVLRLLYCLGGDWRYAILVTSGLLTVINLQFVGNFMQ